MKTNKLSTNQSILFLINYIIGVGFVMTICTVFHYLGLWMCLLFVLAGVSALAISWGFLELVKRYPNTYTPNFLIVRKTMGKVPAFFTVWNYYIQSPIVAIIAISGIIWAFKGTYVYTHYLWALILLASAFFLIIVLVMNQGIQASKIFLTVVSSIKWVAILGIFAYATFIFFKDLGHIEQMKKNIISPPGAKYSFLNLCQSYSLVCMCFVGLEGLTIINSEVKNPKSAIAKAIIWATLIAITLYSLFFLFALNIIGPEKMATPDGNSFNLIIFSIAGGGLVSTILLYVIIIPSQIANKVSLRAQETWVQTRNLLVLTIDGIFPKSFGNVNHKGQFSKCILLDSVICFFCIGIYLILSLLNPKIAEDVSMALNAIVVCFAFIYTITNIAILIGLKRKIIKPKRPKFFFGLMLFSLLGLLFLITTLLYPLGYFIYEFIVYHVDEQQFLANILPFVLFVVLNLIGFGIYLFSKKHSYTKPYPISLINYVHDNPDLKLYQFLPEGENHPLAIAIQRAYPINGPEKPKFITKKMINESRKEENFEK